MGKLTTHILDTALGQPAGGVRIELFELFGDQLTRMVSRVTNDDGRTDKPLLVDEEFASGLYELRFHMGAYFNQQGANLADPPFLDVIPIRFSISEPEQHYHVPLLVSPWAYSTYRGS